MSAKPRLPGERVFTLALLVISLFLLWQAYGISKFESITSAGVFPMLAALAMVVTTLLVVGPTFRSPPEPAAAGESRIGHFVRRLVPPALVGFTLAIAGYMLLLEPLGFNVASFLFLATSMRLLGSVRWGLNLLVSALVLAAIVLIFQTAFSVVLPKGTWLAPMLGVFR
jgi:putative tricarboxylic transport membrane protein